MSTVPIARARFAQTEWEGEALPRQSRREDSSPWRLHVAHIEKEIERVVKKLSVLLAEARACCWDGGLGQEFLVNCAELGRTRRYAPPRFNAIIHGAGPNADADVIVEIEWEPPDARWWAKTSSSVTVQTHDFVSSGDGCLTLSSHKRTNT